MLSDVLRVLFSLMIFISGTVLGIIGVVAGEWWVAALLPVTWLITALDPDIGKWRHIYGAQESERDTILRESYEFMEGRNDGSDRDAN